MPSKKSIITANKTNKKGKKIPEAAKALSVQATKSAIIRAAVPQWFRLDPDQIQGNAGGFVWQISNKEQVIRYLIIGSEGGNFYQTPQQVSSQCASCVLRMTRTPDNFKWLCDTIRQVSIEGRAAKQESTLVALATIIVFAPTQEAKTQALAIVNDCVRILTHMYMLASYMTIFSSAKHASASTSASRISGELSKASIVGEQNPHGTPHQSHSVSRISGALSKASIVGGRNPHGFGRGVRRVLSEYFYSRTGIELANLITKYQNREGWTIKDILTLIHIDPKKMKDNGGRLAIDYVFGRFETPESHASLLSIEETKSSPVAIFFNAIKEIHTIVNRATTANTATHTQELDRIVHLINQVGLCREQLPTQLFKYKKIWEALLTNKGANGKGKGMPLTALIRNLGKLSTAEIGIITPATMMTPAVKDICDRITDAIDIKRSRIHPYTILVAMLTYKKGEGLKGSLKWTPNPQIITALDKAFKLAFQNITPTGKRIKIALDVSGSMSCAFCTGSPDVNCATASIAMMMMTLWTERRGIPPPSDGSSAAQWTASGELPPPARSDALPLWKTIELPDGRTLY